VKTVKQVVAEEFAEVPQVKAWVNGLAVFIERPRRTRVAVRKRAWEAFMAAADRVALELGVTGLFLEGAGQEPPEGFEVCDG